MASPYLVSGFYKWQASSSLRFDCRLLKLLAGAKAGVVEGM